MDESDRQLWAWEMCVELNERGVTSCAHAIDNPTKIIDTFTRKNAGGQVIDVAMRSFRKFHERAVWNSAINEMSIPKIPDLPGTEEELRVNQDGKPSVKASNSDLALVVNTVQGRNLCASCSTPGRNNRNRPNTRMQPQREEPLQIARQLGDNGHGTPNSAPRPRAGQGRARDRNARRRNNPQRNNTGGAHEEMEYDEVSRVVTRYVIQMGDPDTHQRHL